MHLSRIALPLLLTLTIPACAANAGAGASASGGTAESARSRVVLQNRIEGLRLMRSYYPQLLHDAGVTGEVVVQVTLDAMGGVTEQTIRRSSHHSFSEAALRVAQQLQFSAPAQAGERVSVRMLFADVSRAGIAVVD